MNTRFLITLAASLLVSGNAAFAQLGQSGWQSSGSDSGSSSNGGGGGSGLSQSGWQTPSGSSSGGNDSGGGLSQSGWQQPAQTQQAPVQQQQFQQPVQQQQPQQMGQSGWQQPAPPSNNQVGQSGWINPNAPAQSQQLQGNASKSTTLGDALNAGQNGSSDVDPAAAAFMMNQLKGGANGAGMVGAASSPGAMGGAMDPTAAMAQQLGPALGSMMMMMPNNNNGMGLPSSRPFTGGFAVPRRAGTNYSNNNGGGIGSTVNRIVPTNMMQGMMRQMMYQGMSRAMYH